MALTPSTLIQNSAKRPVIQALEGINMKNFAILFLTIFFLYSCFTDNSTETSISSDLMKELEECSNQLGDIYRKKENINIQELNSLLQLVDQPCKKSVEFSQFSNELLYWFLQNKTDIFIKSYKDQNQKIKTNILIEIRSPIHDLIDLKLVYNNLNNSKEKDTIKKELIEAVTVAMKKLNN